MKMDNKDLIIYFIYLSLNLISFIYPNHLPNKSDQVIYSNHNSFSWFLCGLSFLLLFKTKYDPGLLEINTKGIMERQIVLSDPNIKLRYSPLMIMKLMPCNGCKFCHILELPLRSKHCSECQRCVSTYDHHCKIINCCIGENNRSVFCLFLLNQFLIFILGNYSITQKYFYDMKIKFFCFLAIYGFLSLFFGFYFMFILYLIVTNQTTYEIFHKDQCPYLRLFKQERTKIYMERGIEIKNNFSFNPFNSGLKKNIGYALFKLYNSWDKMKWEDIYFENLKNNTVPFNYCEKIFSGNA